MSDKIYQNQLIEQIKKAYIGSILEELGPSGAATLEEQEEEKVGVFSDKTKGEEAKRAREKGFLDVQAIVAKLISKSSGKKGEVKKQFSAEEAISIIRKHVYRGKELSDESTVEEINRHFVGLLQPLEDSKDEPCGDIQTLATRALVNSAYYDLMTEQEGDAAGKINEMFLANLIGGTTIKVGSSLEGADPRVNNIADFKVGDLYFSLKSKTSEREFGGSIKDLLATIGVPFLYTQKDAEFFSGRQKPIGRFFVIFFGKPTRQRKEEGSFSFTTVEIKKENIINLLEGKEFSTISLNKLAAKRKEILVRLIVNYFTDRITGTATMTQKSRWRIQKMREHMPGFQGLGRDAFIAERGRLGEKGLLDLVSKNLDNILRNDFFHSDEFINPPSPKGTEKLREQKPGEKEPAEEWFTKSESGRNRKYPAALRRYMSISQFKQGVESEDQNLLLIDGKIEKHFEVITKMSPNKLGDVKKAVGEEQVRTKEINFKANQKFLKDQADLLGSQLTYSLNLINEYFMSIEKLILEYASRPSEANLYAFQVKAGEISEQSTTTIEKVFKCDDQKSP